MCGRIRKTLELGPVIWAPVCRQQSWPGSRHMELQIRMLSVGPDRLARKVHEERERERERDWQLAQSMAHAVHPPRGDMFRSRSFALDRPGGERNRGTDRSRARHCRGRLDPAAKTVGCTGTLLHAPVLCATRSIHVYTWSSSSSGFSSGFAIF
jgi:hypothetical protein